MVEVFILLCYNYFVRSFPTVFCDVISGTDSIFLSDIIILEDVLTLKLFKVSQSAMEIVKFLTSA